MPDDQTWSLTDLVRWALAGLSVGAAAIHFSVIGQHWHEHVAYGLFFMLVAWFQVAWAIGAVLRPSRRLWLTGAGVNTVVIAVYIVAYTSGLPFGPEAWQPETADALGIVSTIFEFVVVLGGLGFALSLGKRWHGTDSPIILRAPIGAIAVGAVLLLVAGGTSAALASSGGMDMHMDSHAESARLRRHDHGSESMAEMPGMEGTGQHGGAHDGTGMAGMPGMGSSAGDWKYTGPPLPHDQVQLLKTVYALTEKGHAMQTASCTAAPTASQKRAAADLVRTTNAAVAKYHDINVAKADGYTPITNPAYPMIHYIKAANMQPQYVLDPDHVQSLVYDRLPDGHMVLVAAMYLMPKAGEDGPMPGGCLTQWHAHTNLCMNPATGLLSGFAPCPAGQFVMPTPEMLHVWQVPVPGGSLAMDPTDLQVMQAAVMSTQPDHPADHPS